MVGCRGLGSQAKFSNNKATEARILVLASVVLVSVGCGLRLGNSFRGFVAPRVTRGLELVHLW
jgi:hypothetical protein